MKKHRFRRIIKCPTCGKGKVYAGDAASGIISIQCPKCKHCFTADLTTLQAAEAEAERNI